MATWTLPPSAVDLAVNGAGDAWVLTDSGSTLVEVAPPSGTIVRTLDLSSTPANAIAYDPIDGFLFLDAATTAQLEAVTVARLAYAGEIPAPAPLGALAFDGTNGLVASVTAATGESEIVTLIPVPSAPTAFAAAAENNSVSLAWGPPTSAGPDPVLGYSVSAVPVNGTVPAVFENVSNLGTTVGNLTDGVAYNVSVAAYSAAGLSVQPVNATATPAGVPYPPTALAVNATGTASITLQWAAPASDDGSPVFDYVVRYVPTVGGTALTVDAGDQLNVTLVRLTPDTDYSITVTAQNAVGFGHPSASVVARTASTASTPWLLYAGVGVAAIVVAAAVVVLRVRRPKPPAPTAPAEAPSTDWVPDPPEP